MRSALVLLATSAVLLSCRHVGASSGLRDQSYGYDGAGDVHYYVRMFPDAGDVCWVRCRYDNEDTKYKPTDLKLCESRRRPLSGGAESFDGALANVEKRLTGRFGLDAQGAASLTDELRRGVLDGTARPPEPSWLLWNADTSKLSSIEALALGLSQTIDEAFGGGGGNDQACLDATRSGAHGKFAELDLTPPPPPPPRDPAVDRARHMGYYTAASRTGRLTIGDQAYPLPRQPTKRGQRYVVIFSYETPNLQRGSDGKLTYGLPSPDSTHSFVTFFDRGAPAEAVTISWLPSKMKDLAKGLKSNSSDDPNAPTYRATPIEYALDPPLEDAANFTLDETLRIAARNPSEKVLRWGPYPISDAFYERAVAAAHHLSEMSTYPTQNRMRYVLHAFANGVSYPKAHLDLMAALEQLQRLDAAHAASYSALFERHLDAINEYSQPKDGQVPGFNCVAAAALPSGNFQVVNLYGWSAGHALLRFYAQEPGAFPTLDALRAQDPKSAGTQFYRAPDERAYHEALEATFPLLKQANVPPAFAPGQPYQSF
jgi:hypothetical protein